jgi:thiol-disulfide isomerase/thioredoxin
MKILSILLFLIPQLTTAQTLIEGQIMNYPNKEISISSLDNTFGDMRNILILTDEKGNFRINLGLMAPCYLRIDFESDNSLDYLFFPLDTVSVKANFKNFKESLEVNNVFTNQIDSIKINILKSITSINDVIGNLNKDSTYFIDFWATWCGPCLVEHKIMKPLLSKINFKNVVYISFDSPSKENIWKNYVYKNQLSGVHILANDSLKNEVIEDFGIGSLPAYGIIKNSQLKIVEIKSSATAINFYEKCRMRVFEVVKTLNEMKN